MAKKSPREQALLMAFPAFAVIAIYAYWFHFPAQAELDKTQKELAPLRQQGDLSVLQLKTARLSQLRQEKAVLEARKQDLENEWQAMTGSNDDPARRNQRLENLTTLLQQHGLVVVEQAPAEGGKEGSVPALEAVAKRLADGNGKQRPQVWSIRVHGSYTSLHRALQVLAEGEPLVIPLGVSMKQAGLDTKVREWTLVVWI